MLSALARTTSPRARSWNSTGGGVKGRNALDNVVEVGEGGLLPHARGRDEAGVLLAGFRAAFPLIFSAWILKVLQATGVPRA
eukprot:3663859-Pyramimonas_sp.AAC.1